MVATRVGHGVRGGIVLGRMHRAERPSVRRGRKSNGEEDGQKPSTNRARRGICPPSHGPRVRSDECPVKIAAVNSTTTTRLHVDVFAGSSGPCRGLSGPRPQASERLATRASGLDIASIGANGPGVVASTSMDTA